MQAVAPAQMAGLKKRCDDLNIFILTPDSADYPQRLRTCPTAVGAVRHRNPPA